MSEGRRRRACIQLARYVNRYAHIPLVTIGGWAAVRKMNYSRVGGEYYLIRRQQKHPFGAGYPGTDYRRKPPVRPRGDGV